MTATERKELVAARQLRSEQKYSSLLRVLMSRFSQPEDLVVDLLGGTFLTVVACFTMPRYGLFADCEANPECLHVVKEAVMTHSAKDAGDAGTEVELSGKATGAAVKAASLVRENAAADRLWSLPDELPLY